MRRSILLFLVLLLTGCTSNKQANRKEPEYKIIQEDTLYRIRCIDLIPPVDTLEKWKTAPDSILVAFTRNTAIADSFIAYREGMLVDSLGKYYSPAYIFRAVVGDAWVYDINGKFIYFYESPLPHSDKGHKYNQ